MINFLSDVYQLYTARLHMLFYSIVVDYLYAWKMCACAGLLVLMEMWWGLCMDWSPSARGNVVGTAGGLMSRHVRDTADGLVVGNEM